MPALSALSYSPFCPMQAVDLQVCSVLFNFSKEIELFYFVIRML